MCSQQATPLSKGDIPAEIINHKVRDRPNLLEKLRLMGVATMDALAALIERKTYPH